MDPNELYKKVSLSIINDANMDTWWDKEAFEYSRTTLRSAKHCSYVQNKVVEMEKQRKKQEAKDRKRLSTVSNTNSISINSSQYEEKSFNAGLETVEEEGNLSLRPPGRGKNGSISRIGNDSISRTRGSSSLSSSSNNKWIQCIEDDDGKRKFFVNNVTKKIIYDELPQELIGLSDNDPRLRSGSINNRGRVSKIGGSFSMNIDSSNLKSDELLVRNVNIIKKLANDILERKGDFPVEILEHFTIVTDRMEQIQTQQEEKDQQDDVDSLIGLSKLKWNFKQNPEAAWFRAVVGRIPHDQYRFTDWNFPKYYSSFPIPKTNLVTCTVIMPPEHSKVMTHTRIEVSESDTINSAVQQVFLKFQKRVKNGASDLGSITDWVLKAKGLKDYMHGEAPLFSFEYVRETIRDGKELALVLCSPPDKLDDTELRQQMADSYYRKIDPSITPIEHKDYYHSKPLNVDWESREYILQNELKNLPFRVRVKGVENISQQALPQYDLAGISALRVDAFLFHGMELLGGLPLTSHWTRNSQNPRWNEWMSPLQQINIAEIPRASRLAFLLYGKESEREVLLGYVVTQLVDFDGHFIEGEVDLRMWGIESKKKTPKTLNWIFRAVNKENLANPDACVLRLEFDEFVLPVVAPITWPHITPRAEDVGRMIDLKSINRTEMARLTQIIGSDCLFELTDNDKRLLWKTRHSLKEQPPALSKFLQSVDWRDVNAMHEAHRLLLKWSPPVDAVASLELLDCKYADYTVRQYAVNSLKTLGDDELFLYLLQLTQCLKFECYHDSPLARFLIARSIKNPYQIGHFFFWHLRAEMATNTEFVERYGLILEEYLSFSGIHVKKLRKQFTTVNKLQRVAEYVYKLKTEYKRSDTEATKEYHKQLRDLNKGFFKKMGSFEIPLNPKWEATTLHVDDCKFMSSKKIPLWLEFENRDQSSRSAHKIIFKSGDDLRQDILTLQLLTIMDKLWLGEGLDMRLKPYRCIATGVNGDGDGVGMLEIVLNSDTTSNIQLDARYGGGTMGAFKLEPLDNFIRHHNPQNYTAAVDNFIRSCAGYCVATYVLGIGDRHNGNIMITKDGHLFHIDFGHFLGNFKSKFGINRERAAFVFTPEMAFVMGGKKYKYDRLFKIFKDLCCNGYNILRKNAVLLENMFILMVSAQMPELLQAKDINYLRDKLHLDASEKDAEKKFKKEIKNSVESTSRRVDNLIHNLKHRKAGPKGGKKG